MLTVIECAGIEPESVPVVLISAVTEGILSVDPSRSSVRPPVRLATIPAVLDMIVPLAMLTVTGDLPSVPGGRARA